jgi:cell division protein FtsW
MIEAKFDRSLLTFSLISVSFGLVAIYSASFIFAMTRQGDPNYFLFRQLLFLAGGVLILIAALKIPLKYLENSKVVFLIFALQTISLLVVFLMPKINGSHRWIKMGGFTIQPSEFAKITAIIVTAFLLKKRLEKKTAWLKVLVQVLIPILLISSLIFAEPDMGMTALLIVVVFTMLFVSGFPLKYILPLGGLLLVALAIAIIFAPYRFQRFVGTPYSDPQRSGFQIRQSLIAVGSGGVVGKKLGGGSSKRLFLPLPHTDFIFANIAEELGFIGCSILIFLVLLIGYRGFKIAVKSDNPYFALIAFGITFFIVVQSLIHIGVNIYILPPKGMPYPLISYGGSSLLSTLCAIGLLLNISKEV